MLTCLAGETQLQRLGFKDISLVDTLKEQTRILLIYYWLAYNLLRSSKPKYQKIIRPMSVEIPKEKLADRSVSETKAD